MIISSEINVDASCITPHTRSFLDTQFILEKICAFFSKETGRTIVCDVDCRDDHIESRFHWGTSDSGGNSLIVGERIPTSSGYYTNIIMNNYSYLINAPIKELYKDVKQHLRYKEYF